MRALRYTAAGQAPTVENLPKPEPSGAQILLKVLAAGACHSDEFVMSLPGEVLPGVGVSLPLTLGHEGVGVVAELGPAASGVEVGDVVAVYGAWGCGRCRTCAGGNEQYCERADELGLKPPGLGAQGAMAEFLLVDDARHLVPLDGLDPVAAAPLTDAGLTPYHAIKPVLPRLVPGTTAVVIGAGGLGHLGIQMLRALSPCQVIALDLGEDKLQFAVDVGAHRSFPSDDGATDAVRGVTAGRMADAVFDFVGTAPTCALAGQLVHARSDIVVVGVGDGAVPVGFLSLPHDVRVRSTYWGSIPELHEVLALARGGAVTVETETFTFDNAPTIYERMHARTLRGRAVLVP